MIQTTIQRLTSGETLYLSYLGKLETEHMYENCGAAGAALDPGNHSKKIQNKLNDIE